MIQLLFLMPLGLGFVLMGLMIWKKEKLNMIHAYHYKNVAKEDVKAYTEKIGKSLLLLGFGMIISSLVDLWLKINISWLIMGIFFLGGLYLMYITQKKYNGGIF